MSPFLVKKIIARQFYNRLYARAAFFSTKKKTHKEGKMSRSAPPAASPDLPPNTTYFKGKVVVIGEYSVGKTSLSSKFITHLCPSRPEPTVGAAFQLRTVLIPGTTNAVKLEIWDTAGSERYKSLMPMYYRDASVAIVCYDISSARTFDRVGSWIDDFRKCAEQSDTTPLVILAGTKLDLVRETPARREVPTDVAHQLAQQDDLLHFETSAQTNENVTEVFLAAAKYIVKEATKAAVTQSHPSGDFSGTRKKQGKIDLREAEGGHGSRQKSCC